MKYLWLFLIFVVSCCSCSISVKNDTNTEEWIKQRREKIEKQGINERKNQFYEYFTKVFQDSHPTIAASIENIKICIKNFCKKKGLLEEFENYSFMIANKSKDLSMVTRKIDCMNNTDEIFQCIDETSTTENENFIKAFSIAVKFYFDLCTSADVYDFLAMFEQGVELLSPEERVPINQYKFLFRNHIPPTEMNFCLPVRVVEALEIVMIKERKIPFEFRGQISVAAHVALTIFGKYPFKTLEDCS